MQNFFKVVNQDDEENYYFDHYKLILFFVLYTDTSRANYQTKIRQLFLLMSDE